MVAVKQAGDAGRTLSGSVAQKLRDKITQGELRPGQRLSEAALSETLEISRNTLREVFRVLTLEGLLEYWPNRGVFVSTPDMATIVDIYRVRQLIECQAIARAYPLHPAVKAMRRAVEQALACRERQDWDGIGTANMDFHRAIVELADSKRLSSFYRNISAELRLAFGILKDAEHLHVPYVEMNREILQRVEAGNGEDAARMLKTYLEQSERVLLATYARHHG
ncbi:GntR family transcriptional regulator [Izhakiella australiensis]|uniref:GntR family transcriptional regulator n=1 Tax=Izhakiella australiensis TaxID=1926881 RepID=A0A1S8YMA3_9GAMM|nr:GntR family transcriptional regulator [Izhakiella australiensis]OON40144.1 GntR family transcriptional regulator [Izhakiella australiensis]